MIIKTAEEAMKNQHYKETLVDLLYQLADDDFILSFRGSEWLGLAPHIEEDVAFSSISQDMMGHAAMYYQLLEELGEGSKDYLAHGRTVKVRRNAVLLEEANGPGDYLVEPRYDWAFAVVRNYFYCLIKNIKLDSMKNSSYEPLAHVAIKIKMEEYYHLLHWKVWFKQLFLSTDEAREKMSNAVHRVLDEIEGVLSLGHKSNEMTKLGLIESELEMKKRWFSTIGPIFEEVNLPVPTIISMKKGNGRAGYHTKDLETALKVLSEVYQLDPSANW
ncbi:phenylacetate-CoA oxygenase subunit PaaC [Bacillus timonensis]|nr:phenylacetate-CoA oxygenase subunit PaaC [Bacillus timonensis]